MSAPLTVEAVTIRPVVPTDLPEIVALQIRAFGPGRFARSAYRVREGVAPISPLCLAAIAGKRLIASIRFTEVTVGATKSAVLLGPLAVDPRYSGFGHGRNLVAEGLANAQEAGMRLSILVGNQDYYDRFGFLRVPSGQVWLPGPADPGRILAAELSAGALEDYHGLIRAL